jgi:hypothetical protein
MMSTSTSTETPRLSFLEMLFAVVLLLTFAIIVFLVVKWVIETREGKVVAGIGGVVFSVLWLFGAFESPGHAAEMARHRAPPAAIARSPAAPSFEIFAMGPDRLTSGWMAVHGPAGALQPRPGQGVACITRGGVTQCRTMGP